ncbi:MAG: helix-turn-helix transcriptional regulator [Flavisolibacter sp.]|jgi:predicted DNA-binding transcriptional regulator YafY
MNRIDRLLGMVTLLQSRKYVTAEKISDRFEISVRTVYRDIKALCEQGIPVSFETGKGYFIVQGFFIPPVSFSTEEANALLLMDTLVQGFADKSIRIHYSSALNKIKSVLRPPQREGLESLNENIRLQVPACFNYDFEYLSVLQKAIASKTTIELEYRNKNNEISSRMTEPIGLVFYALGWHLIAWCHKRNDYRDFKLVRIVRIRDTCQPFEKKDHMLLNDYMKQIPVPY